MARSSVSVNGVRPGSYARKWHVVMLAVTILFMLLAWTFAMFGGRGVREAKLCPNCGFPVVTTAEEGGALQAEAK